MSIFKDIQTDLEQASVRMVTEYRDRLLVEAFRLCGNQADAEDLVGSVFKEVFAHKGGYDPEKGELYSYLSGILSHLYARSKRRAVNRGTVAVDPSVLAEDESLATTCTDDEIFSHSDHDALRAAIQRLPSDYRDAVLLHYFSELPIVKVACILGISDGTVKWRLSMARKALADDLGRGLSGKKKPLAVLGAILLGAMALFGAYQLVEKVEEVEEVEKVEEGRSGILSASEQDEPSASVSARTATESNAVAVVESISENANEGTNEMNVVNSVRKLTKRLSTVAAAAGVAATTLGAVGETAVYVAPNGNDSTGDGSMGAPFATIAHALQVANDGDSILLADGTYEETDLSVTRQVVIRGNASDRTAVKIDAKKAGRVFTLNNVGAVLANLTVVNGYLGANTSGGANLVLTQGTATNCVFKDGGSDCVGGGGNVSIKSGLIVGCRLDGGYTLGYGANLNMSGGRVSRCEIVNGTVCPNGEKVNGCGSAAVHCGWPDSANAILDNCLILSNKCLSTGSNTGRTAGVCDICSTSAYAAFIVNCTFADNLGSADGWRQCIRINHQSGRPAPQVVNCVLFNNGGTAETEFGSGLSPKNCRNCASTVEMTGCADYVILPNNPLFIFVAKADFRPCAGSPLLKAGVAGEYDQYIGDIDLTGYKRIKAAGVTLGCCERADYITSSKIAVAVGEEVEFEFSTKGVASGCRFSWTFGDGSAPVETDAPTVSHAYSAVGSYTVSVRRTPDGGATWSEPNTCLISVADHPDFVYVSTTGDDLNGDGTAERPLATIARAITWTDKNRKTIYVRKGIYAEFGIEILSDITVRGEGRDDTIIDGGEHGRVFFLDSTSAVLADMTIRNGKMTSATTIAKDGLTEGRVSGANVCLADGMVSNCVLKGGYASNGSDYACGGNAFVFKGQIVDCRLDGGQCEGYGAGAYMYGGRISRCVVVNGVSVPSGNSMNLAGSAAIHAWPDAADAIVDNCLIASNKCLSTGANTSCAGVCDICGTDRHAMIFANCTIVDNSGSSSKWSHCIRVSTNKSKKPHLYNCVFFNNGGTADAEWGGSRSSLSQFHHCASTIPITGGEDCIVVPTVARKVFAYGRECPFEPAIKSALRNAGSAAQYGLCSESKKDIYGRRRISGSEIDIGCAERQSSGLVLLVY